MTEPIQLLVIDDEELILECFECAFCAPEYHVRTARSATEGLARFNQKTPDVVVMDVRMPDGSGLEIFEKLNRIDSKIPIILMTGHGSAATAIQAMKMGAFEYLLKPLQMDQLTRTVASAAETSRMTRTPALLPTQQFDPESGGDRIVGNSAAMQDVYRAIGRVASKNVTVLILGESGTGKEVVARAIYQYSDRSTQRFLPINCAAIPENLLESELFGHEKGAFTNADHKRIGKFELATNGTLFLDEIGDMTPLMQTKILRVLQDQRFERVGATESIQTDARLIAATNRDLKAAMADGSFRSDLFYRLNVFTINLPPLRDRLEDLPEMVSYFLKKYSKELAKPVNRCADEVLDMLMAYQWPGNIRELQSVIKRAVLEATGPVIVPTCIPTQIRTASPSLHNSKHTSIEHALKRQAEELLRSDSNKVLEQMVSLAEREAIVAGLKSTAGNITETAKRLGVSRTTLRAKIDSLNIQLEQSAIVN